MITIKNDRTVFFDVDDTLIMWDHIDKELPIVEINNNGHKRTFQVHHAHVQKIKNYSLLGMVVVVWSHSGYEWAEAVVKALDIEKHVDFAMSKPDRIFDDYPLETLALRKYIKPEDL